MSGLTREQLIRAWRDDAFRNALPTDQQAQIAALEETFIELSEDDLNVIAGGGKDVCGTTCAETNHDSDN